MEMNLWTSIPARMENRLKEIGRHYKPITETKAGCANQEALRLTAGNPPESSGRQGLERGDLRLPLPEETEKAEIGKSPGAAGPVREGKAGLLRGRRLCPEAGRSHSHENAAGP